jgi:hypothetical protein
LRWTLLASTPDLETLVYVDTSERGSIFDIQSDEYAGTSGDDELDWLVAETIRRAVSQRHVHQSLDQLDGRRWGRQGPQDRRWVV